MRVGFMGLGKLGLPVALAIADAGHEVFGYDPNRDVAGILNSRRLPYQEPAAQALLDRGVTVTLTGPAALATLCDVVFVAVQTPHQPIYEGVTPLPATRADFDYLHLIDAVIQISNGAQQRTGDPLIVAVISTVLPGTIARDVKPLLNDRCRLVYTPQFIAMGSTVEDFTHPEFVLLGVDDIQAAATVQGLFATVTDSPVRRMSIESAELTKVAYNTFLTAKVTIANILAQVADATGANVDDVTDALCAADRRLLSPAYMRAGMGDGGGCHPRDNIALSWFARQHGIHDLFGALMESREQHSLWLAQLVAKTAADHGLPVIVLGRAYKPGTNLTVGSPATLLVNQLTELGQACEQWDPHVDGPEGPEMRPAVWVVATSHPEFTRPALADGSVLIDPAACVEHVHGDVTVIRPGRG